MRRGAVLGVLVVLAGLGVPATGGSAAQPLRYVALGDSYSAASGNLPPDPTAVPECARSTRNYGHLIAAATRAAYTDGTCGAAENRHFFTSQYPGQPAQLDYLDKDTQLVTLSIGGNDSNVFVGAIAKCGAAGLSTAGTGSPCKDRYGDSFDRTIDTTTYASTVKTLRAIKAEAPHARIAILTYPWIMPPTVGCFTKMPIATGDVPYVRDIQATLNAEVRRAASTAGVITVDLDGVSNGHDACQPVGTRWVEPVLQGTNPVIVHPNALGEQMMAKQAMKVLGLT